MEPEILDPSQALGDTNATGLQANCFSIIFNNIVGGGVLVLIYGRVSFTQDNFGPRGIWQCLETLDLHNASSTTGIMWTRTTHAATIHRIDFHNKEFSDSKCQ